MRSFHLVAVVTASLLAVPVWSDYNIDPSTVPLDTREQWCSAQESSCPLLCSQLPGQSTDTEDNSCDPNTLDYSCVCSNGQSPNSTEFSQTIPYFECTTYGDQCVASCGSDSACATACRVDNPCGATNPTLYNTTSTASLASPTATSTASSTSSMVAYTGLGGSSGTSDDTSSGMMALDIGRSYSLAVVFAGLFAGFTLFL